MKILITGGKGLVGKNLEEKLKEKFNVFAFGKNELNVEEKEKVIDKVNEIKPDIVIHCAAFSNVDGCEVEREKAYKINSFGTQNIAIACEEIKSKLIYISTDFVFDGKKGTPYSEIDMPNPINHYGKTKLLGEYYVSHILRNFIIIRTSRIFGKYGKNFASRFPLLLKEKKEFYLTTDVISCPTYVEDLVRAIEFLIKNDFRGIINVCNKGECSWFEFGKKVIELVQKNGVKIIPVKFSDYNEKKALRPHYSILNTDLLETLGFKMPEWECSLKEFIKISRGIISD